MAGSYQVRAGNWQLIRKKTAPGVHAGTRTPERISTMWAMGTLALERTSRRCMEQINTLNGSPLPVP